eukprot:6207250-Pyramimonas_sp.AAC.2
MGHAACEGRADMLMTVMLMLMRMSYDDGGADADDSADAVLPWRSDEVVMVRVSMLMSMMSMLYDIMLAAVAAAKLAMPSAKCPVSALWRSRRPHLAPMPRTSGGQHSSELPVSLNGQP